MADDIVERLRLLALTYPLWGEVKTRSNDAADEIERLRAEVELLRAAGEVLAFIASVYGSQNAQVKRAIAAWQEARRG